MSMNFGGVSGSGKIATQKRDIDDFDSVEVNGVFQVEIVSGKDFSVEVQADDNLLPLVKTDVDGSTLKIGLDKRISSSHVLTVRVSAPNIEKIESTGVSTVNASGIQNDSLAVKCSGDSKIAVSGETSNLTIKVSGASNVDADNLKSVDVDVDANGASHANVNVSGDLTSRATGASSIVYAGDPKSTDNHQSGASSISRK
jgi:hypothetical protein